MILKNEMKKLSSLKNRRKINNIDRSIAQKAHNINEHIFCIKRQQNVIYIDIK